MEPWKNGNLLRLQVQAEAWKVFFANLNVLSKGRNGINNGENVINRLLG